MYYSKKCANCVISYIRSERMKKTITSITSHEISEVFDYAWWPLLLHRFSSFSPFQYLISIIKFYFTDRFISFTYKSHFYCHRLTRDSSQDLVLGPILWNILFDNLLCLPLLPRTMLICFCFADDTLVTYDESYDDYISFTNCCLKLSIS